MKRITAALALAGAALFVGGTPASAQSTGYGVDNGTITISVSGSAAASIPPGSTFDVSIPCTPIGSTVTIELLNGSVVLATINATCVDPATLSSATTAGVAVATFTAPTTAGDYTVLATFADDTTQSATVTVAAASATTVPSGGLPATGSGSTGGTMTVAAIVLLAGAGMFTVAQIRRRETESVSV